MERNPLKEKVLGMGDVQVFQLFKTLYPFFKGYILQIMPDTWEPYAIPALDDLANMSDADASEAMVAMEWNYAHWGRKMLIMKAPEWLIVELDKFLDYTP